MLRTTRWVILLFALAGVSTDPLLAQAVHSRFATINGVRLHYLEAGTGSPIIMLHGFGETSHMWLPLIPKLAVNHTVIAPDLRGSGESGVPDSGYDKVTMARDIHALAQSHGWTSVQIVGHDIGLMAAYAYAAMYPRETERVVLMDAFIPGVGNWQSVWLLRDLWHFHFYGKTPLALVRGRERIYLEHFWNDFAANPTHSIPERDRRLYTATCVRAGREGAGGAGQDAAHHADAGAERREGGGGIPHRTGPPRRQQRRGCGGEGVWPLADGGSARSGDSCPGGVPQQVAGNCLDAYM